MIKAIIDIGSNTINLLIAEFVDGRFKVLEDRKIHAKLARGGINDNTIAPDAFTRGVNALSQHRKLCESYGLSDDDIATYATASVRAASNGGDFAAEALKRFGLSVHTIDGETEALLIHAGIKNGFPLGDDKVVIMDIGGGSVEFIITDRSKIYWKQSFYVGVTKLLDRFKPSDPPLKAELEKVREFAQKELHDLFVALKQFNPVSMVGSSGSFDTIRAMIETGSFTTLGKSVDPDVKTWFKIESPVLQKMADELSVMTTEQRKQVPGMDEMRAEYFPLAFVLIQIVLEQLPEASIYQCSYALKEGAFFYHFDSK
ncbi:phosphatase [Saccharicrinis sp. FJH2]|uniref:Ppx/GppA phosphatase family protein n=1 Tax=Saccharicrinis sp. FJH65 TaxID=3344659 RepID=UPI0035F4F963